MRTDSERLDWLIELFIGHKWRDMGPLEDLRPRWPDGDTMTKYVGEETPSFRELIDAAMDRKRAEP
jgi:hypothetical protein